MIDKCIIIINVPHSVKLYNCKSIIESHGGSFEIKSDGPGKGSITTIRLDIDPAK